MTQPSKKSKEIEGLLEDAFGRTTAIKGNRCIPAPIGCGKAVGPFRDRLSLKEYTISGLCQECQDKVFDNSWEV
jgi:hypothetical protein